MRHCLVFGSFALLLVLLFSSCTRQFDKEKVFEQAKTDCYNGNNGLCDADIQLLRDHGDTEDAGIAEGYRAAAHYTR